MSRTERLFLTRAFHEAGHAVIAELNRVRIARVQIYSEADAQDKQIMKMSGAGGYTEPEDLAKMHEVLAPGASDDLKETLLQVLVAAQMVEQEADFTDKTLVQSHASKDNALIEEITKHNPASMQMMPPGKFSIPTKDGTVDEWPGCPDYIMLTSEALLLPSVQMAISEVAYSLAERRVVSGADIRTIMNEAYDRFVIQDEEEGWGDYGHWIWSAFVPIAHERYVLANKEFLIPMGFVRNPAVILDPVKEEQLRAARELSQRTCKDLLDEDFPDEE